MAALSVFDDDMVPVEDDPWRPLSPFSDESYGSDHPFKTLPSPITEDEATFLFTDESLPLEPPPPPQQQQQEEEDVDEQEEKEFQDEDTNVYGNVVNKTRIRDVARSIRPMASRILSPEILDYVFQTMSKAYNDEPPTIYECIAYMFIQASMAQRAEDYVAHELKRNSLMDKEQMNNFCDRLDKDCPNVRMRPYIRDTVNVLRILCNSMGVKSGIMNWNMTFGRSN